MKFNRNIFEEVLERLRTQLPSNLVYHNHAHTRFVLEKADFLAVQENLGEADRNLISIAALYHDTGFLLDRENHEEMSCELARKELPDHGFSELEIQKICGMIMATRIPQQPHTIQEKIVADADLFYLGTDRFELFSTKLYEELKYLDPKMDDIAWLKIQNKFISSHTYHTTYGKTVLEPVKRRNLAALKVN